jgi:hypothetical protein
MFIGHFALVFAAKKSAPRVSLGTLAMAAQFLDLLWPALLLLGMEHARVAPGITQVTPLDFYYYPYSHSLLMAMVWGAVFAAIYFFSWRTPAAALTLGALVVSHWVLDGIVHRPDLPLAPGGHLYFGLGLWNSVAGTFILETGLYIAGVLIYAHTTTARNRRGRSGFWSFVVVLYAIYLGNVFGPPPSNMRVVAWAGIGLWLFVLWAWWLDRNRIVRTATDTARMTRRGSAPQTT